jgi:hypothetical protein
MEAWWAEAREGWRGCESFVCVNPLLITTAKPVLPFTGHWNRHISYLCTYAPSHLSKQWIYLSALKIITYWHIYIIGA